MMPVIRINDATFANLSMLKTWLGTESPSETIDKIVRDTLENLGIERDVEIDELVGTTRNGAQIFDKAPSLTFTKPTNATINGETLPNPKWSSILHTMIKNIREIGLAGEELTRELNIPAKATRYEEEGYKYIHDLGISIQGQSAPDAWKEVNRLANKWSVPVRVEFVWRDNAKAQYPGKAGVLQSGEN